MSSQHSRSTLLGGPKSVVPFWQPPQGRRCPWQQIPLWMVAWSRVGFLWNGDNPLLAQQVQKRPPECQLWLRTFGGLLNHRCFHRIQSERFSTEACLTRCLFAVYALCGRVGHGVTETSLQEESHDSDSSDSDDDEWELISGTKTPDSVRNSRVRKCRAGSGRCEQSY